MGVIEKISKMLERQSEKIKNYIDVRQAIQRFQMGVEDEDDLTTIRNSIKKPELLDQFNALVAWRNSEDVESSLE